MSNIIAKGKDMIEKVTHKNTTTGHDSTNAGPHDSNLANKADPTVDSDLDGSRNAGATSTSRTAGYPSNNHSTTTSGLTGTTATTGTAGTGSTNAGPHNSNLMNKLDPKVDSDLDGSRNAGLASNHNHGATTAGPHSSNLANKADPTVDSNLDGSRNAGLASNHNHGATTAGPHSSNLANKADPTVDSDLDGSRTAGLGSGNTGLGGGTTHSAVTGTGLTGTAGTGPAPHTAGPHKSDMLNKVDPRVDSNLDGSKTVGGDKTYTG